MKNSIFGTDGIRTRVGTYPLDHNGLLQLGHALGQFFVTMCAKPANILIAHDTRISADYLKAHVSAGLLAHPVHLYDAGALPTPAAHALVEYQGTFDYAIMLSASHNPYQDNGIKIIAKGSGKLSADEEQRIMDYLSTPVAHNYSDFGTQHYYPDALDDYKKLVATHFPPHFLAGKTIVLDCAHGATSTIAPTLFTHFGATVITINNAPNGYNINDHVGSLHPAGLQKAVIEHAADIGFGFDGDGDRIVAITRDGTIHDGDSIMGILLNHSLYAHEKTVVGTIMANQGLATFVHNQGKKFIRTPVGDKHVAQAQTLHNALLGGEPSGHIILRDFISSSDGIFAALRIAQTLMADNNQHVTTYAPFPQVIINVPVNQKHELSREPFATIIAATQSEIPLGRIVVRYSGTEALLRILIEDADAQKAEQLANQLAQNLANQLA